MALNSVALLHLKIAGVNDQDLPTRYEIDMSLLVGVSPIFNMSCDREARRIACQIASGYDGQITEHVINCASDTSEVLPTLQNWCLAVVMLRSDEASSRVEAVACKPR